MNNRASMSIGMTLMMSFLLGSSALQAEAVAGAVDPQKEERSPLGCRDVGYEFDMKTVKLLPDAAGERNSLYFFFNKLGQKVNLYQMRQAESSVSLFLNHAIQPRQWGVLSTNEKMVKYICTVDDAKLPYGRIVDCADSIKVCEYANVKYGLNNRGNLWLVSSNTRDSAVQIVLRYGIIPR